MCGRFILGDSNWADYHAALSIVPAISNTSHSGLSYNIKPTQTVEIAYANQGGFNAGFARWWFVPSWHKGALKDWKATTFNAKIETANRLPTFRNAWRSGRCLIPAGGYYEWSGPKGKKLPWLVRVEQNAPVFFFAGLMSNPANDPTRGPNTCTILTRPAAPEIAGLHPRMPVILGADETVPWLRASMSDDTIIDRLGTTWQGRFRTHRVAPFGRDDDGPHLIEPIEPPQIAGDEEKPAGPLFS